MTMFTGDLIGKPQVERDYGVIHHHIGTDDKSLLVYYWGVDSVCGGTGNGIAGPEIDGAVTGGTTSIIFSSR